MRCSAISEPQWWFCFQVAGAPPPGYLVVDFHRTPAWDVWDAVGVPGVMLSDGENKVRLIATGSSG